MAQIIYLHRPVAIPEPEHPRDHYRERPEGLGAAVAVCLFAPLTFFLVGWAMIVHLGPLVVR